MERKIGEIFEYNCEWYQCVGGTCRNCSFYYDAVCKNITTIGSTNFGNCHCSLRTDHKSVIFKKLEKVGEPFTCNIHGDERLVWMQEYKLYDVNFCKENALLMYVSDYKHKRIAIEIKQNKEDMEEKKQKMDDLVGLYSSGKITYKEFDKELKALYSCKEEIKPALKEFDLEAAKAGKPVCTRDGRKARIICFDRNDLYPIVALIECEDGKEIIGAYSKEGQTEIYKIKGTNLMMLPEKKEGWVNIDKGGSGKITISSPYSTKEEAVHNDNETTIDTIKIYWEE